MYIIPSTEDALQNIVEFTLESMETWNQVVKKLKTIYE